MNDVFETLDKLPNELIDIIYSYMPSYKKVFLSKQSYIKYHYLIQPKIVCYDSFIRACIRSDNNFVFNIHVIENNKKWLNKKKYNYNNNIFANYGYFLMHYCIEQRAENCKKILIDYWNEHGLCQNRHKKIVSKHIRWKT